MGISVSAENLEQLPDDGPPQLRVDQYVTEPRRVNWQRVFSHG